jgi:hypothetical protein
MPLRLAPGAKVQGSMGNMVISAWYAMDREAYSLPSPPESVRIALARERRFLANIKIGVKSAAAQAGRMYIKAHPQTDEYGEAPGKQGSPDHGGNIWDR